MISRPDFHSSEVSFIGQVCSKRIAAKRTHRAEIQMTGSEQNRPAVREGVRTVRLPNDCFVDVSSRTAVPSRAVGSKDLQRNLLVRFRRFLDSMPDARLIRFVSLKVTHSQTT